MESFFNVKRPEEVHAIIDTFGPLGEETVPLSDAFGRVLSADVVAPEDLPGFFRSAMDGYAVRSRDTFGASEALPALLEVSGEVLMGRSPEGAITPGQAVRISTGGMLPEGADGVVMVEYCHLLDDKTMEVSRSISPLENVIRPGDDYRRGAAVLSRGSVLRPQDVGLMAGLGISRLRVYQKPIVAVISTGDEIVPLEASPGPGQVRDINRYTLAAFCRRVGAEAVFLGHCPDDFDALVNIVNGALGTAHAVWISGGSSVGTRDLTLKAFKILPDFQLLVHGISISPGKPTIIGRCGGIPLIGLPGHVASTMVVAEVFLARLIHRLSGRVREAAWDRHEVTATLTRNIESAGGREEYVRVRLNRGPDGLTAEPVFGKSGLVSVLVESHGLVKVDMNTEGLYQGESVQVWILNA